MLLLALILLVVLASCSPGKQTDTGGMENSGPVSAGDTTGKDGRHDNVISGSSSAGNGSEDGNIGSGDSGNDENGGNGDEGDNTAGHGTDQVSGGQGWELLQSASVDLNNDGVNEQVKAVMIQLPVSEADASACAEGRLVITGRDIIKEVVFREKETDGNPEAFLSGMEFADLDGDGAKDVFMVIPGYGASFSYSNYFIYSCKKDRSYSFSSDNTLADFIGSFKFRYINGGNKLTVTNEQYNFSADLIIDDAGDAPQREDIMNSYAERAWIDPVSVDISEDSRLALVKRSNRMEIKVPLPVFGLATVDMIAELDLFYSIDESFEPVLTRCELIDFSGSQKVMSGGFEINDR